MYLTEDSSVVTNETQGPVKYPPEITVVTGFHAQHDTKTTSIFIPAHGETNFQGRSPYYQAVKRNQKTPILVSSR